MTTLAWPCAWLDPATTNPTRYAIDQWAVARINTIENAGPNRSGAIDGWNTAAGAPLGSPWCAAFAFSAWKENGATPLGDAACQTWHVNADKAGRFLTTPDVGDIVLFDFGTQAGWADHCGVVSRIWGGFIWTIEGNTNSDGGREGDGVYNHKWLASNPKILGYVSLGV